MRKRQLAMILSGLPRHPEPKPELEQYVTPGDIAADMVMQAHARGDIEGRHVLDLGAGTGVLAVGASLLGAARVTAVETDETSIQAGRDRIQDRHIAIEWQQADATTWDQPADTVVMNPPFGAQFAARNLDARFLEAALRCAPVAYSLHTAATRDFLAKWATRHDAADERLQLYLFPLPAQFRFHSRETVKVPVDLHRFTRPDA